MAGETKVPILGISLMAAGAAYLAVGAGVAAWTGARGEAGKPHYEGKTAAGTILTCVVAWPYVVAKNLTAKDPAAEPAGSAATP